MNFDVSINITSPAILSHVGHRSKYSAVSHPGSGNKIEGWRWGEFFWPSYAELSEFSYIPTLFDLKLNLSEDYYQSGFGSDEDIKLIEIESIKENKIKKWIPIVNTGHYHIYDVNWYLFSDQHISEYLSLTNSLHTLTHARKERSPIFIGNYKRDIVNSRIKINLELKYNVSLDSNGVVEDPAAGEYITVYDEATDTHKIKADTGTINNVLQTFSITSTTESIELSNFPMSAAVVVKDVGSQNVTSDWSVDADLGILSRVDSDNDGLDGYDVTVTYTPELFVKYEPDFATERVAGMTGNVNSLQVGTNTGFVQVTTEILDPYEIDLETDLDLTNAAGTTSLEYLLSLGNNVGKMEATVKNKLGTVLEGVRVYFDWEEQKPDGYGVDTDDVSSLTDGNGRAYMYYNSPNTISDLGVYVLNSDITILSGTQSEIFVSGITPSSINDVFLYEIRHDDPFYGLDSTTHASYYTGYFSDEEITDTNTANKAYEEAYRFARNQALNFPDVRPPEITNITSTTTSKVGQKRMVFETSSASVNINPNTAVRADTTNFLVPLKPLSVTANTLGTTTLVYDAVLNNINNVYQYFIVSGRKIKLKAWARNNAGQKIFSNEIIINITLPDSVNGVYYTEALNTIPAALLNSIPTLPISSLADLNPITYSGVNDTTGQPVQVSTSAYSGDSTSGYIPLGFRIKSAGITVAALLDQVTFITKV